MEAAPLPKTSKQQSGFATTFVTAACVPPVLVCTDEDKTFRKLRFSCGKKRVGHPIKQHIKYIKMPTITSLTSGRFRTFNREKWCLRTPAKLWKLRTHRNTVKGQWLTTKYDSTWFKIQPFNDCALKRFSMIRHNSTWNSSDCIPNSSHSSVP